MGLRNIRSEEAQQVRCNVEVMLIVFFYCEGVIHCEFLPHGRKVNMEYYLKVMKRLRESVRIKRSDLRLIKNGGSIMTLIWHIPPSDSRFSHKTWDITHSSASILVRPCTGGLLSLQPAEIHAERMMILVRRGD